MYILRFFISLILYFTVGFVWCYLFCSFNSDVLNTIISIVFGIFSCLFLFSMDDTNKKPQIINAQEQKVTSNEFESEKQFNNGFNTINDIIGLKGVVEENYFNSGFIGKLDNGDAIVIYGDLNIGDRFVIMEFNNECKFMAKKEDE